MCLCPSVLLSVHLAVRQSRCPSVSLSVSLTVRPLPQLEGRSGLQRPDPQTPAGAHRVRQAQEGKTALHFAPLCPPNPTGSAAVCPSVRPTPERASPRLHPLVSPLQDDPVTNLNNAFEVAEKYLDIPKMLDAEGERAAPRRPPRGRA